MKKARWASLDSPEVEYFVALVERIRHDMHFIVGRRKKATWDTVLIELERRGYRVHANPGKLRADWRTASRSLERRLRAESSLSDLDAEAAEDFIDDVEKALFLNKAGEWEIDWLEVLNRLHPDDASVTPTILKAWYESALDCCYWRYVRRDRLAESSARSSLHAAPCPKVPRGLRKVWEAVSPTKKQV